MPASSYALEIAYINMIFVIPQKEITQNTTFVQLPQSGHIGNTLDGAGVHQVAVEFIRNTKFLKI